MPEAARRETVIASCRHCHRAYWRYRRDHPPAGFCSTPHAELGGKGTPRGVPQLPQEIRLQMQVHRREEHFGCTPLEWHDCARCEELEAAYADSISYHALIEAAHSQPAARAG
jgi:hypothetical protein